MTVTDNAELRIGVIGLGGMGTFHARALAAMSGATVAAVSDPFNPGLPGIAAELGATVFDDPMVLATDPTVDAIVVASPDDTHAALAMASIEHERPVLCEKPLATTVDEAVKIVAAEAKLGRRVLQLGFMREYDDAHRQVVDAIADLGAVHHIRCVHTNTAAARRPLETIVGQSMVHDIHTVRFLTGSEFESVVGHISHDGSGRPRHVLVTAVLSTGAHATLEFEEQSYAYHVGVEVTADLGTVSAGGPVAAEVRRDGHRQVEVGSDWFARFAQAYRSELSAWVGAAGAGGATGPSAVDGLASQRVVAAIVESIENGGSVTSLDAPGLGEDSQS